MVSSRTTDHGMLRCVLHECIGTRPGHEGIVQDVEVEYLLSSTPAPELLRRWVDPTRADRDTVDSLVHGCHELPRLPLLTTTACSMITIGFFSLLTSI